MNFKIRKSDKAKLVRSLFSAIKRDDINRFEGLVTNNAWLFDFKNNKRENILFYAFENNSKKIINAILENNPKFLKEKNILNLNIIHELINKNKNIDYFLEKISKWDKENKHTLFTNADPQGNNLLLMSAKSGNKEYLDKIINICPDFTFFQKHSNFYGQNIAHLMSIHMFTPYQDIIEKLNPNLMSQLDNINGFSPLMLSAYYQGSRNFSSFFKLLPLNQKSFLENELIHFAANNHNVKVTNFLINNGLFSNNLNKYGQSPLFISLSKGYSHIAKELFLKAKEIKIYQDDLVCSAKIADKEPELFEMILNNETNEKLSKENQHKFLEILFLHGKTNAINIIKDNKNTKNFFIDVDFSNLFSKTVTGKKDMIFKINLLLENKDYLNKEEVFAVFKSLEKIPANQILSIFKNSNLLSKVELDNKPLLIALTLEKGLDPNIITNTLNININNELQSGIKQALRNTKYIEKENHLRNIEYWLNLFKDKKIVLKHYGMIASKSENPFHFIDEKFNFLTKENKKELVYYTITALFKKSDEISEESLKIIEKYPNLLSNVYSGIIKVGKIPCNQKLIEILNKIEKPVLDINDLSCFFSKTNDKHQQAINIIKETINLFNFKEINNMQEFCQLLISNPYHKNIVELILNKTEEKDLFIETYLKAYLKLSESNDPDNIVKIIMQHSNNKEIAKVFILNAINEKEFFNIETLNKLKDINIGSEELSNIAQSYLDNGNYSSCIKLQKCFNSNFDINKLNLKNIDWKEIDQLSVTMSKDDSFFEFLNFNQEKISEKQLEKINYNFITKIKTENISLITIDKYLNSLSKSINKMEPSSIIELCSYVLEKHCLNNPMAKFLFKEKFENIFKLIAENHNNDLFEKLQNHKHYEIIEISSRRIMDREILDKNLSNNNINVKIKKNKI